MGDIKELNNSKLNEMIIKRDELLKQHPQLRELQFQINDLMAGAGSQQNKQVLLKRLMLDSMKELQDHLNDLQIGLNVLQKAYKDEKKS